MGLQDLSDSLTTMVACSKDATTCQILWEPGKRVCSNLHPIGDQVQLTPDYSGIKTGKILVKSMLQFFFSLENT